MTIDHLWIERYPELLGCDSEPAAIAVEIQRLKDEVDRARKTIASLRKLKSTPDDMKPIVISCGNGKSGAWMQ
jgi:hypothetical protein